MIPAALRRASFRYLLRHPSQFGLSIAGVAIGVAVVVSVDLANESANRAFRLSSEAVTGKTTHQVLGGPRGLDEGLYRQLRVERGVRHVAPVVDGWVSTLEEQSKLLRLLGLDPFVDAPFRSYLDGVGADIKVGPLLVRAGACLAGESTARRLGIATGDEFEVRIGTSRQTLVLVGVFHPADPLSRQALDDLLIVDISTAQELLGMQGRLSRLDLIVDQVTTEEQLSVLREMLPVGSEIVRPAHRSETTQQLTRAFRVNLTALSLLALICGTFLVYNTMAFSVVQRRSLIGAFRAVGVTRRQILALILGEAAVVGTLGTVLGLTAGIALGRFLVRLVTRTINDLYFVVSVSDFLIEPASLLKGAGLGLLGAGLAALWPALEATTAPPRAVLTRSSIETRARRAAPRAALTGLLLLSFGGLLLVASGTSLVTSFVSLFAVILGFALLTPGAVVALMGMAKAPLQLAFGTVGRMAARGVVASLSRTGVAIAALMIAVSVIIGVGVMIDSFRGTVEKWLLSALAADLYVAPPAGGMSLSILELDDTTRQRIEKLPSVEGISTIRGIVIETRRERTRLLAFDLHPRAYPAFDFKDGDPHTLWRAFEQDDAVIVTEPYAYRHGLSIGDAVVLRTDRGEHQFPLIGIYYNYASDQGLVAMSRETYRRYWNDPKISGFSVYAREGADLAATGSAVRELLDRQQITVQSSRSLREASLEVFDRTFLITGVLQTLVTLVAFIGVLNALMALQLERTREIGVLRAIGFTPREVWRLVSSQSTVMGLASAVLAIPVGLTLAAIMIFVINRRSFGWSLDMQISPAILLQAALVAVIAAVAAGLYPALRMSSTSPAVALREE